ncbi:MAG: hypothetical protein F6K26_02185 [Moorea sp. SIO2I5]|nr:hypothetical protein [Moorena sp. SIO2I5]
MKRTQSPGFSQTTKCALQAIMPKRCPFAIAFILTFQTSSNRVIEPWPKATLREHSLDKL